LRETLASTFLPRDDDDLPSGRSVSAAIEKLQDESNPFLATIGLQIDPAPIDSGIGFRLRVEHGAVPMYVYKTAESFTGLMAQYARDTLHEGLYGWQVTDCVVTLTHCGYSAPATTAADFRKLTPLVLMSALERAGTEVCEPMIRVRLDIPTDVVGTLLSASIRLGALAQTPSQLGELSTMEAVLPAARVQDLRRQLAGLTRGEGVLETEFGGYQPVSGVAPTRKRSTANPLNRGEYLMHLARRLTRG
jgi:ribosomal protection tetracycline resistance protein